MTKQKKDTMRKLGILAGNGVLPAVLIERCQKEGCPFFVLALKGHAEEDLLPKNIPVKWVRLGSAGKMYYDCIVNHDSDGAMAVVRQHLSALLEFSQMHKKSQTPINR